MSSGNSDDSESQHEQYQEERHFEQRRGWKDYYQEEDRRQSNPVTIVQNTNKQILKLSPSHHFDHQSQRNYAELYSKFRELEKEYAQVKENYDKLRTQFQAVILKPKTLEEALKKAEEKQSDINKDFKMILWAKDKQINELRERLNNQIAEKQIAQIKCQEIFKMSNSSIISSSEPSSVMLIDIQVEFEDLKQKYKKKCQKYKRNKQQLQLLKNTKHFLSKRFEELKQDYDNLRMKLEQREHESQHSIRMTWRQNREKSRSQRSFNP